MTSQPDMYPSAEFLQKEREKWDAFYTQHPAEPEDATMRDFYDRLALQIAALLPDGARILEVGCGGGWQSLALARLGRFEIHLSDFSAAALQSATERFAREKQKAEFSLGDVFDAGRPEYDLVFNAGSLEHYPADQQVAFLRGMASRSRRYVLGIVPNNLSYWYWIWRVRGAARGQWPYGSEVPVSDLSRGFQGAGMTFLGCAFLAEEWTEGHIKWLDDLTPALREDVLAIHRSPVILPEHKAYLYAGLGTVDPSIPLPENTVFSAGPTLPRDHDPQRRAVLADALALQIGNLSKQRELTVQLAEVSSRQVSLADRLHAAEQELAQQQQEHQSQIAERDKARRQVEEQLLGTQQEIARQRQEHKSQLAELDQARRQQLRHLGHTWAQQQRALQTQIAQRDQARHQIEDQINSLEQTLARQQETMQAEISRRDQARERVEGQLRQSMEGAGQAHHHAAVLQQMVADVRVSRRYKIGNILSALKQRPLVGTWRFLKWAIGGYRRTNMGLAGALEAPDPLQPIQQSLADTSVAPEAAPASPMPANTGCLAPEARCIPAGRPIAFLVKDLCDGGVERVVMDLCVSLRQLGRRAQIVIACKAGRCATEAKKLGIEVITLDESGAELDRYLDTFSPQIVVTHHCYFGWDVLHRRGIPVLEALHTSYYWQKHETYLPDLRRQCISGYIAVSSFAADYCAAHLQIPREKIDVVPNGLNVVGLIRPPVDLLVHRRRKRIGSPTLIHVANVYPSKNHRLAIKSFAELVKDFPTARLIVCGASDYFPDMADAVVEDVFALDLFDKVVWKGAVDRRSLSRLLANAHIGILPSSFEGFSIATLEYAYFGLPSILSQTGASKDLLDQYGHGLLARSAAVPPDQLSGETVNANGWNACEESVAELKGHMAAILGDYETWLNQAARTAARYDEYSIDATARKYVQVIDRYL